MNGRENLRPGEVYPRLALQQLLTAYEAIEKSTVPADVKQTISLADQITEVAQELQVASRKRRQTMIDDLADSPQ